VDHRSQASSVEKHSFEAKARENKHTHTIKSELKAHKKRKMRNLTESDAHVQLQRSEKTQSEIVKRFFLIIIQLFLFQHSGGKKKEHKKPFCEFIIHGLISFSFGC
jgi:hypothetical protein